MTKQPAPSENLSVPADPDAPDAIEDLKDWQDHQFVPGYYTGGNIHPMLRNPGKPVWLGVVLLLSGLVAFGSVALALVQVDWQTVTVFDIVLQDLLPLGLGVVLLAAGIAMILRGRKRSRNPGMGDAP